MHSQYAMTTVHDGNEETGQSPGLARPSGITDPTKRTAYGEFESCFPSNIRQCTLLGSDPCLSTCTNRKPAFQNSNLRAPARRLAIAFVAWQVSAPRQGSLRYNAQPRNWHRTLPYDRLSIFYTASLSGTKTWPLRPVRPFLLISLPLWLPNLSRHLRVHGRKCRCAALAFLFILLDNMGGRGHIFNAKSSYQMTLITSTNKPQNQVDHVKISHILYLYCVLVFGVFFLFPQTTIVALPIAFNKSHLW